jgi:ribosomal protein S18 acetylase RimI-like enzyme
VQIRPASLEDVAAVDGLVQRAYGHYVERIGRRPGPMDEDYGQQVAQGHVSVAVEKDEIVGLIVLVKEPDHLLVENVAVEPERQSQGIGRACSHSPRGSPPKRVSRRFVSTPMPR